MPNGDEIRPNPLGDFIRTQRQLAQLSLRQLSAMTDVSNPYLSQLERGLHEPSMRILKSIADALNVSAETMLAQAGLIEQTTDPSDDATEAALRADPRLTESQKRALLTVYLSYIHDNDARNHDAHDKASGRDTPSSPASP